MALTSLEENSTVAKRKFGELMQTRVEKGKKMTQKIIYGTVAEDGTKQSGQGDVETRFIASLKTNHLHQ
ncbi:MAG: hypothetical protein RM347_001330 [Nostoc sp. ChiQUE02]|uniref:hypothetical protein n=1 Tax=Nostoc sp. ChiQUE02 TaxID=3075377 RepID=UPI002AD596C9|nr:hypothetical protein [Nostoc sp. ChiQUE02]MDZ8235382.1 hypothetical protein [Nostoc sp. ChiQUE02]